MADQIAQNFIKVNPDGSITFDFAIVAEQRVQFPFGIDVDQGATVDGGLDVTGGLDADAVDSPLYTAPGALDLAAGADGVYATAGAQLRRIINTLGWSDFVQHNGPAGTIDAGNTLVTIAANQLVSDTITIGHTLGATPTAIHLTPAHPGVNNNLIAAVSLHYFNGDPDSFDVQARAAQAQSFDRPQAFSWLAIA